MTATLRHSRRVRYFKRGLTLLALATVVLLGIIAWWTGGGTRLALTAAKTAAKAAMMEHPFYRGLDSQNRPYTVRADKGTQLDAQTFRLEPLKAELALKDDGWTRLEAGQGVYDNERKTLALTGGVALFYVGGYQFRTDHADVDVEAASAEGNTPIAGEGPAGTIQAERFTLLDGGDRIYFEGNVNVTINRAKADE